MKKHTLKYPTIKDVARSLLDQCRKTDRIYRAIEKIDDSLAGSYSELIPYPMDQALDLLGVPADNTNEMDYSRLVERNGVYDDGIFSRDYLYDLWDKLHYNVDKFIKEVEKEFNSRRK